nr:probable protein phosphatase 2C 49 [Ipomoea trifida]
MGQYLGGGKCIGGLPNITYFRNGSTTMLYTNDLNRLIKKYKFSSKHSFRWPLPCSFYAVFDGHGGSAASAYVKDNALRFFFEDAALLQASIVDKAFLEELGLSHHRAFLLADQALADDCSIDASCRKGNAVQISHDHKHSCKLERKRVNL